MYSPEFRAAALQMVYKSGNIAATARRFQIARNTLTAWVKADRPWWHRPAAPKLDEYFDDYDDKEVER